MYIYYIYIYVLHTCVCACINIYYIYIYIYMSATHFEFIKIMERELDRFTRSAPRIKKLKIFKYSFTLYRLYCLFVLA